MPGESPGESFRIIGRVRGGLEIGIARVGERPADPENPIGTDRFFSPFRRCLHSSIGIHPWMVESPDRRVTGMEQIAQPAAEDVPALGSAVARIVEWGIHLQPVPGKVRMSIQDRKGEKAGSAF